MKACGIDLDAGGAPAPGRLLHQPRGAAARLRGGAHPAGLAHRRLVRLLRPPAVDRRAHPPDRRRPRRVPRRRRQPARRASSARRHRRRGRRAVRAAQPRPGARPPHADHPHGRRATSPRLCRRSSAPSRDAGHPVVWACDPMHGNTFASPSRPQDPPLRRRPRRDRRRSFPSTGPGGPGRAACTWS